MRSLPCRRGVIARLQLGKAATDLHYILCRLFPKMLHHLSMNQASELTTKSIKNFVQLTFRVILLLVMGNGLTRQVVQQPSLSEIIYVVIVDKLLNYVILKT